MTTALDLITQALKATGVVGVGQTPLAEDVNDSLLNLKQMMAQWQRRRWMIPSLQDIAMFGNNQVSNTIGIGGYYNYPRPDKILAAYVRLYATQNFNGSDFNNDFNTDFGPQNGQTTQSGSDYNNDFNSDFGPQPGQALNLPVDYKLRQIFSYEDYSTLALKSLNSFPFMFFYDNAYPMGNVFIWPVPNQSYQIHLIIKTVLTVPTNVTDVMMIPEEYEEVIWTNLAVRLCINYQLSASPELKAIAKVALNTIKNSNAQIPSLSMPTGLRNENYNIFNDSIQ